MVTLISLVYRLLLHLYPARFRRRFGAEMGAAFRDGLRAIRDRRTRWRFAWRGMVDLVVTALAERRERLLPPVSEPPVGGPGASRDDRWGERSPAWEGVARDLSHAVRSARREPGFTVAVVLSLALGIGANTAIFSFVDGVLLRPLPYSGAGRLTLVWLQYESADMVITRQRFPFPAARLAQWAPLLADDEDAAVPFESLAHYRRVEFDVSGDSRPERVTGALVDPGLFDMLGVSARLGRDLRAADSGPDATEAVVISEGMWRRRFGGDPGILGRPIRLDSRPHTIVGVMPGGFRFPGGSDVWLPADLPAATASGDRWVVLARSRRDSFSSAEARASAMLATMEGARTGQGGTWSVWLEPLRERVVGDAGTNLLLALGAVGCLLLIACANVGNLLLSRGRRRRVEMAIRAALGAGRGRIVRQLATEAMVLALAGGAAGLAAASWGIELIRLMVPASLPRVDEVGIDLRVTAFTFGIAVVAGLVLGLVPAWRDARRRIVAPLQSRRSTQGEPSGSRLRGGFVVVQVGLAVLLLAAAGLLVNSFARLLGVDPGFDPEGLVVMELELPAHRYPDDISRSSFLRDLLTRLQQAPGLASAAVGSDHPFSDRDAWVGVHLENRDNPAGSPEMTVFGEGGAFYRVGYQSVGPGFLPTLGVPLLAGRGLRARDDRPGADVALVNHRMATQAWPGEEAVGKRFRVGDDLPWLTVVGVVGDLRQDGFDQEPQPRVYTPYSSFPGLTQTHLSILLRPSPRAADAVTSLATSARDSVASLDPELPVLRISSMEELMASSVAQRRFYMVLMAAFAAAALLLAASGVYGVMAFAVARRVPEIGVRMALGATSTDIRRLVLGRGLKLTALGVTLGLAAALGLTRFLQSLLYGVSAHDPATLVVVIVLLVGTAGLAAWLPARRATRIDPLLALRGD